MVHAAGGFRDLVDALSRLDMKFPTVDAAKRRELDAVRRALMRERD